jgi:hypothetical protein
MSDKLDKAVSAAFKELSNIDKKVSRLKLILGHVEEISKKHRDNSYAQDLDMPKLECLEKEL